MSEHIGDSGHDGYVSVRMCGDKIKEKEKREQYFVAKRGEKKFKGGSLFFMDLHSHLKIGPTSRPCLLLSILSH